jgi:predicted nucleic acid-binding protein
VIVVADSSPLHYLILIDQVQLLPRLFDLIAVPDRVVAELTHPRAPGIVTEFISNPPDWLEIHVVERKIEDPDLVLLHPGEQSAILLAEELRADLMLIDDSAGRRAATQRQIRMQVL